jgi:alkylation response protein AidB-like acyl-CoA dehydrogenase
MNMEFGFTEEEEKVRKEVHDFLIHELPEDVSGYLPPLSEELQSFWTNLQMKAGKKGYLASGWPEEYGGLNLGPIAQGVVNEEEGFWHIRWPNFIGRYLAGPTLFLFGTEEQKRELIPPIARGEVVWYECFTEPDAGTDESNIQTRAVKDGDDYILNGQKIYITGAYKPDWLYTLARTADTIPRHRGLSLFIIPANTEGITIRPLPTMGGDITNEIFFDEVRVPEKYLVGEENRGFYHAMTVFEFERANTHWAARAKRDLQEFVQFCRETKRNGKPLIEDPEVRRTIARIAVEVEVWRLIGWRTVWRMGEREKLGSLDYDLTGFFTKRFNTSHPKLMLDILGPYGQLRQSSKWAKLRGNLERRWRATRSLHIAGTIEAYMIVLAERGLGLPGIPAKLKPVIMQALQEKK